MRPTFLFLIGLSVTLCVAQALPSGDVHFKRARWESFVAASKQAAATCPPQGLPHAAIHMDAPPNWDALVDKVQQAVGQAFKDGGDYGALRMSLSFGASTRSTFGFGTISAGNSTPPSDTTQFRIGSVSKVFTTALMMRLHEQGSIGGLDYPISASWQQFREPQNVFNDEENLVTWRNAATQLAGLPRETPCNFTAFCHLPETQILQNIASSYLVRLPQEYPSYSNLGFSIIGNAAAAMAKTDFTSAMRSHLLDQLGLHSTGNNFSADVQANMAQGYAAANVPVGLYDFGWNRPAGQMFSNINDLDAFTQLLIHGVAGVRTSQVLAPETIRTMHQIAFLNADGETGFGMPWELRRISNYLVRSKGGNVPGYAAAMSYVAELALSVNLVSSRSNVNEFALLDTVYNLLLDDVSAYVVAQQKYTQPRANATLLKSLVGTYKEIDLGVPLQLALSPTGTLVVQNQPVVFEWHADLMFSMSIDMTVQECMATELLAQFDSWVFFQTDADDNITGFTMPGMMLRWAKQ